MSSILIVEDSWTTANSLKKFLEKEGFKNIDIATNKDEAFDKAMQNAVKLIFIDINLQDKISGLNIDGINLAKELRDYEITTPIIFLTGVTRKEVIELTINIPNSYFLTKPFREFEVLRRVKKIFYSPIVKLDNEFSFNYQKSLLYKNGNIVKLNKQQTELLKLFIENKNILIEHDTIIEHIWGDKEISKFTKHALINKLKKALDNKFIKNIPKVGYIFEVLY